MIHEKNLKQKSLGIVLLNLFLCLIQNVGLSCHFTFFWKCSCLSNIFIAVSGRSEESSLWRIRKIGEVPIHINFVSYIICWADEIKKEYCKPLEFLGPNWSDINTYHTLWYVRYQWHVLYIFLYLYILLLLYFMPFVSNLHFFCLIIAAHKCQSPLKI